MVFSSLVFLSVFFPVVFVLYQLVRPLFWKNVLLIIASLLFYAYGEPVYILLMLISIGFNFLFGLWLEKAQKTHPEKKAGRFILALAVIFNIGLLFIFKYLDMSLLWINQIFGLSLPMVQLALPIGISFFTFQALSYVIDVYRKEVDATHKLWVMMLYISFFPQLIAGPIVKYHDIDTQIQKRELSLQKECQGLARFILGLSKKVLIANTMAMIVDTLFALPMSLINIFSAWLAAIAYVLQIFFDFDGYSDMAIGMSRMFGFELKENFNYPYIATSIQDFWRRWHISLSTWFKEYLYIPLGGNRKGKLRTDLNKFIVFTATGLWHGANLTFLLWGWWHGFFILLESHVPYEKVPRFFRHIITLLIVILGFVMFRAEDVMQGLEMIGAMFTGFNFSQAAMSVFTSQLSWQVLLTLGAGILFSMPVGTWISRRIQPAILYSGSFVLLTICLLFLASGTYNPFIYFRF